MKESNGPRDLQRRVDQDVVDVRAAEHAEHPFIEVHDGHVEAALGIDNLVAVDTRDQVVPKLSRLLQNGDVAGVEHVPCTCRVTRAAKGELT